MKRSLGQILFVCALVLTVYTVTSCKKNDGTAAAAKGNGEITYWNIGTDSPDKDIVGLAVKKFSDETDSGFALKSVAAQNDKYKEKLVVAMSSGEAPDMYSSWSGGPLFEYIDSGFGQPLDEYLEKSPLKDLIMDAAFEQATYKGKIYGIPYLNVSLAGIFYNKDLFNKYGLTEPKTLGELEAICKTLKENKITPFALANRTKWTGSMYFICLATRYGGLEPFQNAVAGTGSFEDETFIRAGETLQNWVKAGYFPDGVNSLSEDDGQARQLIYQETAGMLLCGSWYTGTFASDNKDFYQKKIGWFPFPAVEGSSADPAIQIGTVGDQFITINCTGDKMQAAFDAAASHLSDEVIALGIEKGKIPPIKGIESRVSDPLSKLIIQAANNAPAIQLWYDQYLPPAVATAHLDGLQEVFGLTKTPAEAQKMMQKAMQDYRDLKK